MHRLLINKEVYSCYGMAVAVIFLVYKNACSTVRPPCDIVPHKVLNQYQYVTQNAQLFVRASHRSH